MLSSNPFKSGSKAWVYCEHADIDWTTGYSKVIYRADLDKLGLGTTNGGDWCRSDGPLGRYFNVDRVLKNGRIASVQLVGYRKNAFNSQIRRDIRDFYAKESCRILDVRGAYIEIDHKDGRKDDVGPEANQSLSDFQPLHKSANDAKRQHCKDCKLTDMRFDATRLGYAVSQWVGGAEYKGSCVGCFWYDPAEFNAQVSKDFVKDR